jgi:hypothetical protein
LREGTAPPVTAAEAAAALDVLEAARRSAGEGRTVTLASAAGRAGQPARPTDPLPPEAVGRTPHP